MSSKRPCLDATRAVGNWLLRQPRALAWIAPLAWMVLIWSLSGVSEDETQLFEHVPGFWFNFAHAGEFGILALLILPNLRRGGAHGAGPEAADAAGATARPLLPRRAGLTVILIVFAYALIDEWHQLSVPGRVASPFDVLTDVVGAICVVSVAAYAWRSSATEAGLRLRYLAGLGACVVAAGVSTLAGSALPELHLERWPEPAPSLTPDSATSSALRDHDQR